MKSTEVQVSDNLPERIPRDAQVAPPLRGVASWRALYKELGSSG